MAPKNEMAFYANSRRVDPALGFYEFEGAPLPDTVGHAVETIAFRFQYSATGETFVDENGNGVWDAGEPFTDANGDGVLDEDWRDIPGSQTTSHLVYRLAAAPATEALQAAQGHERLYLKITDFTCCWGSGKTTTAEVFDAVWKTSRFWTPFIAVSGVDQPDNGNGFHGVGDPAENVRQDEFLHSPKSYTYEHLAGTGTTVDSLLDANAGRCGAWSKFLPAFAAQHGMKLRAVYVLPRAFRSASAGNYLLSAADVNALAVGEDFYLSLTQFNPDGSVWATSSWTGVHLHVKDNIDGQAHSSSSGTLENSWGDGHGLSFEDSDWDGKLATGENIFDPSYEHENGDRKDGFTSQDGYEDDAILKLRFLRVRVANKPVVKSDSSVDVNSLLILPYASEWNCSLGEAETLFYVP